MEISAQTEGDLREQAIQRLKKKRDFRSHAFIYVAVNAMLVVIWAITAGYLVFGQLPREWSLAGAAIVIASGLYILYREHKLRG